MIRRKRLGAEMRRIRKDAGLTGSDLAQRLGWSESKISRVETARIGLSMLDARLFIEELDLVGEDRERLLTLAEEAANTQGWWSAYRNIITSEQRMVADVEAGAVRIRGYFSFSIYGLLQTADYARAVLQWYADLGVVSTDIDAAVDIRLSRRRILDGEAQIQLVFDESVLRRQVDGPEVMRDQLRHLIKASALPNLSLHVLPLAAERPPATFPFVLFDFRDPSDPPMVGLESMTDMRYFSESSQVDVYELVFARMLRQALSEQESVEFIAALIEEIS